MEIRYEIEPETNAVKIFYNGNTVATINQPNYPNGDKWDDAADAENWAKLYIESVNNQDSPFPPNGKGQLGMPKPTPEQIKEWKEQRHNIKAQRDNRREQRYNKMNRNNLVIDNNEGIVEEQEISIIQDTNT